MLSNAYAQNVSVDFATADGTAVSGTDYVSQSGTLTFAAGETIKSIAITINGDTLSEPDETYLVMLTNPTAGAAIGSGQATGSIKNDDVQMVTMSFTAAGEANDTGTSGGVGMQFTVSLSAPSAWVVSANYFCLDGSATMADNDYICGPGQIVFQPGETSKHISTVAAVKDQKLEGTENFIVVLVNITNADSPVNVAYGTIRD